MRTSSNLWWLLLAAVIAAPAQAALRIFACEPEWAALARELMPEATIDVATTARQDPHFVQARPSLIAKVRQADLAVCTGAELEIGWLPALLIKANNSALTPAGQGLFYAADQVEKLDVMATVDRAMGDVHAGGNPHIHLSPERILLVADALALRLQQLAPADNAAIAGRLADFRQRWLAAMQRWQQQGQPLNGMRLVAYHSSYRYLFDWLGIEQVGDLEPKPGLPPTSGHLASLLAQLKSQPPQAIVHTPYQEAQAAAWLSEQLQVPALVLPYTIDEEQVSDLFALYDQLLASLGPLVVSHAAG